VFLAWTATDDDGPWIETRILDDSREVLDADLAALSEGRRPGFGSMHQAPVYLVCTNGKVDACCAAFGRRTAAALTAARPTETWESSHLGGDRFAANLVCLPHGIYYGHVEAEDALPLVQAYEDGRLDLRHLRGRAAWPMGAQAADWFVRRELGLDGLDSVGLVSIAPAEGDQEFDEDVDEEEGGEQTVVLSIDDGRRVILRVGTDTVDPPRRIICLDKTGSRPKAWGLRSLQIPPAGSPTT
jgi:hypothetical protein